MKVLFFIGSLRMGGAENVASQLSRGFEEILDWQVTIVTGDAKDTDFYPVSCSKRVSLNFDYSRSLSLFEQLRRLYKLRKLVKAQVPDYVVMFSTDSCIRGLVALIGLNQFTIACEHSNYNFVKSPLKRLVRNITYSLSSKVFLLTERDIENYPRFLRNKFSVMHNPLGIVGEMNNKDFNYKLLAVGRLSIHKGYDRLLKNFSELSTRYTLSIVGDGELMAELVSLAKQLKIQDRVCFVGATKNVKKYYKAASLLLLTSRREGLPVVIAEANAFGLPVISYDCETGPRELIIDGENGFVVDNDDSIAFNAAIDRIAIDPMLYKYMSCRAYYLAERFSIDKICRQWRDELQAIKVL